MKLNETGPLEATPKRSKGRPSVSTIVARTVMVPSLAMAALWIFTTTPVFPRGEVVPLSGAGAAKSTGRLAGWRSSADAVLNKTAGAKTSTAQDRYFLMDHSLTKENANWKSHSIQQITVQSRFWDISSRVPSGKNPQTMRNSLHIQQRRE